MVIGTLSFLPAVVVRASIDSAGVPKKISPSPSPWWNSLFAFSSEPDYINSDHKKTRPVKSRFEPVSFSEEKARQLRRMTNDASSFHDSMYHSAVASRLASDFSHRTADN